MKKNLPYLDHDAQNAGPQYLEDLATGYWYSELLFTAVELDLFSCLDPDGDDLDNLSTSLNIHASGLRRYLHALASIGLVVSDGARFFNTKVSQDFLVKGKEGYQGDSILWRRYLQSYWNRLADCLRAGGRIDFDRSDDSAELQGRIRKYIRGMDSIARSKSKEILRFVSELPRRARLLDVGAGSGAVAASFLDQYPDLDATLVDLPEILGHTQEMMKQRGFDSRATYRTGNILEHWPVGEKEFDLVILSNIIHAYSEQELPHILAMASKALKDDGLLVIHDFFTGHYPAKAALSDLNMFINTFNGMVFCSSFVEQELTRLLFEHMALAPLESDTAVLFASKSHAAIEKLHITGTDRLCSRIQTMGFSRIYRMKAEEIVVGDWPDLKCRFGCDRYGSPHCPPNSPDPEKTRSVLKDYSSVLLLEGEPPTRDFQMKMLQAEREAFVNGFHKAFAYWTGPCALCDMCVTDGKCRNTAMARPSMEGSGIDVFETVRRAGSDLRPLGSRTDFAKYYGLLLLE